MRACVCVCVYMIRDVYVCVCVCIYMIRIYVWYMIIRVRDIR